MARRDADPGLGRRRRAPARRRAARRVPDEQLERARARQRRPARRGRASRPTPDDLVTSAQAAAALLGAAPPRAAARGCSRARARASSRRCRRTGFETVDAVSRPRRSSSAGTATSTSSGCAGPPTACGRARASSPRISTRPIRAPRGCCPGAGSLVAAVATAGGRRPEVAGKPEPAMAALVRARYGDPVVMIGDRPVDRRRVRDRARRAVRARAVGRRRHGGRGAGSRSAAAVRRPRPRRARADAGRARSAARLSSSSRGVGARRGKPAVRASTNATSMPNTKPPMCASVAMPLDDCVKNCSTNQSPSTTTAGSRTGKKMKTIGTSVRTRARGNHTMYAPITTAIAPDAPRNGDVESRLPSDVHQRRDDPADEIEHEEPERGRAGPRRCCRRSTRTACSRARAGSTRAGTSRRTTASQTFLCGKARLRRRDPARRDRARASARPSRRGRGRRACRCGPRTARPPSGTRRAPRRSRRVLRVLDRRSRSRC